MIDLLLVTLFVGAGVVGALVVLMILADLAIREVMRHFDER